MRVPLRPMMLGLMLLLTPGVAHAIDLCVDFTSGEAMTLRNFGGIPNSGRCNPVAGFFTPFFSLVTGSVCRSGDGNTLFVSWTSAFIGAAAAHIGSAEFALPVPSSGTGYFTNVNGSPSSLPFNVDTCNRPVP